MKTAMITGVNGQDGSYLSELLLEKGYKVVGLKRRSSTISTNRIDHLISNPDFYLRYYDLMDGSSIFNLISKYRPHEFYNLAAQSHVAVSFEVPEYTTEGICMGTLKILECLRSLSPNTRYYQASSSEMFGDSDDYGPEGYSETSRFSPVSPYAVSKLYSHHLTGMYRSGYRLHASSGILFNHESPRRGETFVTRKITMAAARIKFGLQHVLELGNLDSKRDWGHAKDYVSAMWLMLQQDKADDYVIATGETYTVRDFLTEVFDYSGLGDWRKYVVQSERLFRPNEVPYLLGDSRKARTTLGWKPAYDMATLAREMYDSDYKIASDEAKR